MKNPSFKLKSTVYASVLLAGIWSYSAQSANIEQISQANFSGDIALLEQYTQAPSTPYNSAYASWRLAGLYFAKDKKNKAINALSNGIQQLESAEDVESRALLANLYGFRFHLDSKKHSSDGKHYAEIMAIVNQQANTNPRVALFNGLRAFHTPEEHGGSILRAASLFEQSIDLFESASSSDESWGKSEAYIWASLAYEKLENFGKASEYRETALKLNPSLKWMSLSAVQK